MSDVFHRYVSYVVGTFLCFPIRCFHLLPVTKNEDQKQEFFDSSSSPKTQQGRCLVSQKGVKRSCGQSQRSARLKHNDVPVLKRK